MTREDAAPTLTTERLDLILPPPGFIEAILAGARPRAEAMVGVRLPEGWPNAPQSREGLAINLAALRRDPGERPWRIRLIVLREERRAIGSVNLKGPPERAGVVDVGWDLEPADRGRGFATEAARAVVTWALSQPGVQLVTARIHDDNVRSVRVAERLGMRRTTRRHPEHGMIWEIASLGERLSGTVVAGAGEGARFVALDWFGREVRRVAGFDPYPGTLNLRLEDHAAVGRWRMIRGETGVVLTPPGPESCGGRVVPVVVEERIPAAVVIPDITRYGDEVLEVVAPEHLRTRLGLVDGDLVSLTIRARRLTSP